jgi:citrate lyase beta subunit
VAFDQKAEARAALSGALDQAATLKPTVLRINGSDTEWHADDVAAAAHLPVAAVMLPKAESDQCEHIR